MPCCMHHAAAVTGSSRYQSISPARRAHSSKPAAAACSSQQMGQTDRQTDRQTDTVQVTTEDFVLIGPSNLLPPE